MRKDREELKTVKKGTSAVKKTPKKTSKSSVKTTANRRKTSTSVKKTSKSKSSGNILNSVVTALKNNTELQPLIFCDLNCHFSTL